MSRLNSISWPETTVAANKAITPTAAAALPFAIPFPPIRSNHILHELFGGLEFRTQWTYHQSQRNGYSDETVFFSFASCWPRALATLVLCNQSDAPYDFGGSDEREGRGRDRRYRREPRKTSVAKVYLTDGKNDLACRNHRTDRHRRSSSRFPPRPPGRLALMVLTTGKEPKCIEQPVKADRSSKRGRAFAPVGRGQVFLDSWAASAWGA